jgi:predicted PurR-regulated permease PerM
VARWGVVAWSVIGIAILGYLAWQFVLYPIRIIFPPLVLALIIVFLLNPIVSRIERGGLPRIWGTLLTYLVFLSVVGLALAYLIPVVSEQVGSFVQDVPSLLRRAEAGFRDIAGNLGFELGQDDDLIAVLQRNLTGEGGSFVARITSFTAGVFHVALILVLGPIIAFYLLVDMPKIRAGIQAVIPAGRRGEAKVLGERMSGAVGGFFRGQLLVAVFVGLASMLVLYIVGLPFWALVGLLTGLFNLIPLIGPIIGSAIAALVALTTSEPDAGFLIHPEPGFQLALASVLGLLLVQQIDNHIISPNVVARTVKLHPVTVMLSLLAGGTLLGLWGMLLAVPVVATVKILLMHYWDTRSSWPPRAQGAPPTVTPAVVPSNVVSAPVGAADGVGTTSPASEPEMPRAGAREGVTGHWWWRVRTRMPWRRRRPAPEAEPPRAPEAAGKPS